MTGKTHYRLGIMYYLIFSVLPLMSSIPIISSNNEISLAAVGAAALGALIVDSDTDRSLINQINPITYGATTITSSAERIIKRLLRLILGTATGFLVLDNLPTIVERFGKDDKAYITAYVIAFTCIFAGITNERFIQSIPLISTVYNLFSAAIKGLLTIIKRFIILLLYLSAGIGLIVYNFKNDNEIMLYIAAIILLGTAIFPHRTFLHSIEGLVLYTVLIKYIANIFGYPGLGNAFFIGYFSHIYLADILTNSGIPVSVIPTIFKKIGIHNRLMNFAFYRVVSKVLDAKLSIEVMSTGTSSGSVFEYAYCMILFILAAILVVNNYNVLTFSLI